MTKKSEVIERAVVICTAKRGVFFGYTTKTGRQIIDEGKETLLRARMCSHWSKETHGVLGLAGIGPQLGSRVGPQVPEITVESVTAVMVCAPGAIVVWEAAPWT